MKKGKRYKRLKNIRKVAILLLSIVFFSCITYLVIHYYIEYKNKSLYDELYKEIEQWQNNEYQKTEGVAQFKTGIMNKIIELQQQNEDIKGWLCIENTNINYPILQTNNNDYYLTHDFKKNKNPYGSIFINSNSKLNEINSNTIIYGHNMKNGQMFYDLTKYEERSFYDQHQVIKLTTEDTEQQYQIISVFKSTAKKEPNTFKYYEYSYLENEDVYKEYINHCKAIELYDTGVSAEYGEQLITLVTCEYSQEDGRMVVVAKKCPNSSLLP